MIKFTQYKMPWGVAVPVEFTGATPEVDRKAIELQELGFKFECEVLSTGHVSLTIEDPTIDEEHEEEQFRVHEVVENGEEVVTAINTMVGRVYERIFPTT